MVETLEIHPHAATQLTEEIMNNLDENNDGYISVEEFADNYIEIVKKLRMRQIECEEKMLESYEQFRHCSTLSKELQMVPAKDYKSKVA